MRKVIKKYDDFVRSKSINEDIEPVVTPEASEIENQEGFESTEQLEDEDSSNIIDSEEDVVDDDYEEEESGEYKGTSDMKELAKMLGTEVKNNEIDYDGKKIHYYSETESFHIDGIKNKKFKTVAEVVDFLKPQEEVVESKRFIKKRRSHKH